MKKVLFYSIDKVSDNNQLIKLELRWTCSADTVTDGRCDENVLNLTVLGIFIRYMCTGYSMFCVGYGIYTRERSSRVYIS